MIAAHRLAIAAVCWNGTQDIRRSAVEQVLKNGARDCVFSRRRCRRLLPLLVAGWPFYRAVLALASLSTAWSSTPGGYGAHTSCRSMAQRSPARAVPAEARRMPPSLGIARKMSFLAGRA